ncbi:MAG: chromate efflux transporter [Brevundimonas sp.]|uniref:chromate efflux transporter n=1 Tax=Brevundimonas sp. TaxID=1871086 RepID=UPI0027216404|nr:chromate efflux transporter [Brevundimonas sp.]MDO9607481.1 chromate efflux transporter [Brevundimonas sp.]
MTVAQEEPIAPRLTLLALFLKFLHFGVLAFGGPVAQIAMIRRQLVEREGWISGARFNRLLAVMQALPGPEAHELCVHMGMLSRGRIGGVLAGLGFMAPGFVLMMLAAWAYDILVAGRTVWAGALLGVQIVVVALIIRAVQRIGRHVLEDRLLWLIAGLGFASSLIGAPFWIPLVAGGLIYGFSDRPWIALGVGVIAVALSVALHTAGMTAAIPVNAPITEAGTLDLFVAGLKGGLLTFGGAYTAIPYVRADTVGRGWLSDGAFLDGVALAGVLPAPLVIFGTFAGYVAGGWTGALAVTAGIFLPAFAFSLILFERLEAVVDNPALHRVLAGIAAAVVGIIGATGLQLTGSTLERAPILWVAVLVFLAAVAAVWLAKGRWTPPLLIVGGALAGRLVFG